MGDNHVWLTLRRREKRALEGIVEAIKSLARSAGPVAAAGAPARIASDIARYPKQVNA